MAADLHVAIDDDRNWIWDSRLTAPCSFVPNTKRVNYLAVPIGQKWKCDVAFFGEFGQHIGRVITDSHDLNVGRLDCRNVLLQLYQLRDTEWSPIGRAIEDQSDGFLLNQLRKRDLLSGLVP